jgi:DNA modification methylase
MGCRSRPHQEGTERLKAVRNSSKSQGLVFDPFGGSGSTLIACETTGRQARLNELDPRYVDVIVKRWQDYTGRRAVLEGDGRELEQVAFERS